MFNLLQKYKGVTTKIVDKSKYSQFDSGVSNHSFQDQFVQPQ